MLFVTTCLFTCLYLIRPFEILEGMRGWPILFCLGMLAGVLLLLEMAAGRVRLFRNGTDQMMLGLYAAVALSQLVHFYFGGAVTSMTQFFPVFIGYFIFAHAVDSEQKLKVILFLFVCCAAFIALEGVQESRNGVSFFGVQPIMQNVGYDSDGVRLSVARIKWVGPFSDPNDLAMVFVVAVPILLDYLSRKFRLLPLGALVLICYGLYLTNSRGGMLSVLAATFAYLVLRFKSFKGFLAGMSAAALLLVLGPSRLSNMSASEDSAYGRLEAWYSGYQMFKSSPLFGVGKGLFTDHHCLTAHNSFVLVFAELGVFGTVFFVGMYYFPLVNGYKTIFGPQEGDIERGLLNTYSALLSGLTGILVSMFFLSRSYELLPYLIVALLIAFPDPDKRFGAFANALQDGMQKCSSRIVMVSLGGIALVNLMIKVLL